MDGATRFHLWLVPVDGDGESFPLIESEFDDSQGQFSPDGRWLAYTSDSSGEQEVYLQRLDGIRLVRGPQLISYRGGEQPRWRSDGTEHFFLSHGRLMVADVDLDADVPAGTSRYAAGTFCDRRTAER
jgi:Tol biopolymer transport system component